MHVERPTGHKDKVVVIGGQHRGRTGVVESRSKRLKAGMWKVKLAGEGGSDLISPVDMVSIQ